MEENEIKLKVKNTFNLASSGYDLPELRFFEKSADFLVDLLDLKGDENIVDICTGTGHVPLRIGKKLAGGSVTGVDISENMIAVAEKKVSGMDNVNFVCADLDAFSSEKRKFDIATCAFGIFFFPDMSEALQKMKALLNNDGKLFLSNFDTSFMEPQRSLFGQRLISSGISPSSSLWMEINTEDKFRAFLEKNEFKKINIYKNKCGYSLNNAEEWWNIIMNTNMRSSLEGFSENELSSFKKEHIDEVNGLNNDGKGIPLIVDVLYAKCAV